MFLKKKEVFQQNNFELKKNHPVANSSRIKTTFLRTLPLQLHFKKLTLSLAWNAGRSRQGRTIVWTKGRRLKKTKTSSINNWLRDLRIGFVASFNMIPAKHKILSLFVMSSGSVSLVGTSTKHELFRLSSFYSPYKKKKKNTLLLPPCSVILPIFFLIQNLPKNQPISLLEPLPGKGIKYARSTGVKSIMTKMDSRISTSLIKLPSGVKKIFSTFALGSEGAVALPLNKKYKNNKAGHLNSFGKKPKNRGVARNPVDHPHGGRAKAIAHQRTPWGKTTKRK